MVGIAMASAGADGGGAAAFVPLLIVGIIWGVFNVTIASRKGKNKALFFCLSLIPGIALFISIYLASLTDRHVLAFIERIENR